MTTFLIFPATATGTGAVTPHLFSLYECSSQNFTIQVMDDDEMLRDVLKALLENLGHEVIVTEDGTQAMGRYREFQKQGSPIDLVILDLTIPGGMGGRETAEKLLHLDPKARLIVASGYSNDPVMSNFRAHGFQAAISKPFILEDLNKAITTALS